MSRCPPMKSLIAQASEAHTNLTVFSTVLSILEGGHVYGRSRAAERIIRLCREEMSRQFEAYEKAARAFNAEEKG